MFGKVAMGGGFQREVFIADLELKKLPFSCIHLTTVPLCGLVVEIVRVFTQPPFIRVAGQQQEQTRQTRNTISDGLPPSPFANSVHPLLQSLALLLPAPDREREREGGGWGGEGEEEGREHEKKSSSTPFGTFKNFIKLLFVVAWGVKSQKVVVFATSRCLEDSQRRETMCVE